MGDNEDVAGGEVGLWKLRSFAHERNSLSIRGQIIVSHTAKRWARTFSMLYGRYKVVEIPVEGVRMAVSFF